MDKENVPSETSELTGETFNDVPLTINRSQCIGKSYAMKKRLSKLEEHKQTSDSFSSNPKLRASLNKTKYEYRWRQKKRYLLQASSQVCCKMDNRKSGTIVEHF
jgi:hypothetical protein